MPKQSYSMRVSRHATGYETLANAVIVSYNACKAKTCYCLAIPFGPHIVTTDVQGAPRVKGQRKAQGPTGTPKDLITRKGFKGP